jgi:hypothetical protein
MDSSAPTASDDILAKLPEVAAMSVAFMQGMGGPFRQRDVEGLRR